MYLIIKFPWDMKYEKNYFSMCNNLAFSKKTLKNISAVGGSIKK